MCNKLKYRDQKSVAAITTSYPVLGQPGKGVNRLYREPTNAHFAHSARAISFSCLIIFGRDIDDRHSVFTVHPFCPVTASESMHARTCLTYLMNSMFVIRSSSLQPYPCMSYTKKNLSVMFLIQMRQINFQASGVSRFPPALRKNKNVSLEYNGLINRPSFETRKINLSIFNFEN